MGIVLRLCGGFLHVDFDVVVGKIQNHRTCNDHDTTHPKPPGGGFRKKNNSEDGSVNQFTGHQRSLLCLEDGILLGS